LTGRTRPKKRDVGVPRGPGGPPHLAIGRIIDRYMTSTKSTIAVLCLSLAGAASAQTYALRAARIFDSTTGKITAPGLVVVANGKIESVGGAVPAGAESIDLGDATRLCAADVDFPMDVTLYSRGSFALVEQRYKMDDVREISNWWQERMRSAVHDLPSSWIEAAFSRLTRNELVL